MCGRNRAGGAAEPATIEDGTLTGVTFSNNRVSAAQSLILMGGSSLMTEDTVVAATVDDVTFESNTFLGSGASVFGGLVTASGAVNDSRVENVGGSGNVGADGDAVVVSIVDQLAVSGAPADSVQRNSVANVKIE